MFNITNYFDHPTRIGYTVFKFSDKSRAQYFEDLLKDNNIWFEISEEDNLFLFGIKKGDFQAAQKANYLVSAAYRKKTISNKYIRWFFYSVVAIGLTLAIIGALKN